MDNEEIDFTLSIFYLIRSYMLLCYKQHMKKIILLLVLSLLSTGSVLAKDPDWLEKMKQIKLLSYSRDDVLKLLGNPVDNDRENHLWYYDFKSGRMAVIYETGGCVVTSYSEGKAIGWKVPEYTVVEVSFSPDKHISPRKSFINFSGFTKIPVKYADDYSDGATPDDHRRAPFQFEYKNDNLGIHYFEDFGKIDEITFYPPKQLDYLLCTE